jgi:hypothetical protein
MSPGTGKYVSKSPSGKMIRHVISSAAGRPVTFSMSRPAMM